MQKIGVMVMSVFAVIWFAWGLSALPAAPMALYLIPVLISGALIARVAPMPNTASAAEHRRIGKAVGWASFAEGIAILAAVNILNWIGQPAFFVCAVAAIVGVHFFPLARSLNRPNYYFLGSALVTLALIGCVIKGADDRLMIVAIGAALLLWTACAAAAYPRPARQSAV